MTNQYDVIVIGAGPGGASAAALLAKKGKRVLLVDKNKKAGGRMMTLQRDGFSFELFPINCVPTDHSRFETLLDELGLQDQVERVSADSIGVLMYEDEHGVTRSWDMGDSTLALFKTLGVPWWNLPALYRTLRFLGKVSTLKADEIEKLYAVSAMDYVDQFEIPKGIRTYFLASFGEGAFEMTSDRTSAAEAVKLFQEAMKNGGGRYYSKGIGHVFEVCAGAVENLGGTVLMKTRAGSIDVENGRVTGITTVNGEQYFSPLVISSAGIRQTVIKLVGEEHYDQKYVEWVSGLESNLACAGYRWVLNKPVLKTPMTIYFPEGCVATFDEFEEMAAGKIKPSNSYIYLGTTSLYQGMAPQGKQLVYAVMSCLPDPELDIQPYLDYVRDRVRKIMPEVLDCIELEETVGPANVPGLGNDAIFPGQGGESYGLALSVGQAGNVLLGGDSPIDGLYYVGCDAGGSGLGTNQAVDSALNVTKMVLGEGEG
ncbi:MAG: FAD-dependent oxidoreductase [Halieaceae bacterium]|nr:FAD-dependent oxidoreductase [Halieaceae bacterium]